MIIGTSLKKNKKKNKIKKRWKTRWKTWKRTRGTKKKQDKKQFDPEETIKWMFNKEDAHVNNELSKKTF